MSTINARNKEKLIVLGLDGATFDVIDDLIALESLPNMKSLIKSGIHSILESTFPPLTAPAWQSLATGRNPGKTGISYFFNRSSSKYEFHPVTSADIKGKCFWDYLGKQGVKCGIFNYPFLYPAYPLNGFMVGGLGANIDENLTYPQTLQVELNSVVNTYENVVPYNQSKYHNNESLFLNDIGRLLDKTRKGIKFFFGKKKWDLFMAVVQVTDWLQHYMWKHWDKNHPSYHPQKSPQLREQFITIWERIDELIGEIRSNMGDNTSLIILSDHGFGPNTKRFYFTQWLEQEGYLTFKRKSQTIARFSKSLYKNIFEPFARQLRLPIEMIKKNVAQYAKLGYIDTIDFKNTKAFALPAADYGGIFINHNCKNINLNKTNNYEELRNELIDKLYSFGKSNNLKFEIYKREQIYCGPKIKYAPDIVFSIDDLGCSVIVNEKAKKLVQKKPFSDQKTGAHRKNGIFIASGNIFRKDKKLPGISIYDVFPTLLSIFNIPIPQGVDGEVKNQVFTDEFRSTSRKTLYVKHENEDVAIKKSEPNELEERLRDLGYL